MASYVESATRTFEAGGAIAKHLRVKLSTGKLAAAGLADKELGEIEQAAFADGDMRSVRLRNAPGTHKMVAAEALVVGAQVYTAAAGKVADTFAATSFLIGTALTAATADGDIIEVLPNTHGDTAGT